MSKAAGSLCGRTVLVQRVLEGHEKLGEGSGRSAIWPKGTDAADESALLKAIKSKRI